MTRIGPFSNLALAVVAAVGCWPAAVRAEERPPLEFFEHYIRPILVAECYDCHNSQKASGGLALDHRDGWKQGGDSGPAIVPGDPEASLLIRSIRHEETGLEMPAKAPKLDDRVIGHFVTWVKLGAFDPRDKPQPKTVEQTRDWADVMRERADWWSFKPMAPAPSRGVSDGASIDAFVGAQLTTRGLASAPQADKNTRVRRLYFALIGLPPTPDEVEAYVNDAEPHAWERLVDRLLASPRFGERWARHWMDLVRYSDSHGSENDDLLPFAYRYRDYLVRAFNADVPYDQFVREQIAGDQLPEPRWNRALGINESLIGTAFWRMVEFYHTPVDVKREEVGVIDSQIDTLGKSFQALTISCARCHDHKFDPISDEDFYALYGIVAGTRLGMRIVDDPQSFVQHNAKLREFKRRLLPMLAASWLNEVASWPQDMDVAARWLRANPVSPQPKKPDPAQEKAAESAVPASAWTKALYRAARQSPGRALAELVPLASCSEAKFVATWSEIRGRQLDQHRRAAVIPAAARVFADFRDGSLAGWRCTGLGLPDEGEAKAGNFVVATEAPATVRAVYEPGYHSDGLSDRHAGSLRSPNFTIEHDAISVLARGSGDARLRLVIENYQGEALLYATINPKLNTPALRWFKLPIREQWRGRRAYLELLTQNERPIYSGLRDTQQLDAILGRSGFGIALVVFHSPRAALVDAPALPVSFWQSSPASFSDLAALLSESTRAALQRWVSGACCDEDARLLTELFEAGVLGAGLPAESEAVALLREYRALESTIPVGRRVPGVFEDGYAEDAPFFPRGDYKSPSAAVPRRYLEILGSRVADYQGGQSGRLQLAYEIANPANPLTARVMANRVWHWLLGQGLVRTVDNFGRLGEQPAHPELLDYLAREFIARGWSLKALIREIVTSQTWQRASTPPSQAAELDPANRFWSHANVRRLDAEAIRDALLAIAGNLNPQPFGPGTPVYYKVAVDPDHQVKPGPLDGGGRRSVYLEVRRNSLSDFLLAFDFPKPLATAGRRSETNVPAQSLALLNDPFVRQQAEVWAQRILRREADDTARIGRMYAEAFCRPPSAEEVARGLAFIKALPDEQAAWIDFAHALMNTKEMIYLR